MYVIVHLLFLTCPPLLGLCNASVEYPEHLGFSTDVDAGGVGGRLGVSLVHLDEQGEYYWASCDRRLRAPTTTVACSNASMVLFEDERIYVNAASGDATVDMEYNKGGFY